MTTVVIGVGNPYRHDDGAGPAVAERLRHLRLRGVTVVDSDGEPSRLLDLWDGAGVAVVVDAVCGDAEPGTVHRAESFEQEVARPPGSSHSLDLIDAWALSSVMGRRPERLIVYGIVGERFEVGPGLSPAVAEAVEHVADAVAHDVGGTVQPCA